MEPQVKRIYDAWTSRMSIVQERATEAKERKQAIEGLW